MDIFQKRSIPSLAYGLMVKKRYWDCIYLKTKEQILSSLRCGVVVTSFLGRLSVLTDLQARGVENILIASVDGLQGFPEAINAIFPKTEVQLCIVHQIRNSIKYVASKDQKEFTKDLKLIYQAPTKEIAQEELLKLEEKWGKKYPLVINSWQSKWENISVYFKYPKDIRRIIYTTNIIESVHRQFRKLTKTKGAFPNEISLIKLLYLGIQNAQKRWTMPIRNWSLTLSQLAIFFEGRLDKFLEV